MPQSNSTTSDCFAEFQAELKELLQYKWTESEKAGVDIGFEKALAQWTEHFRLPWRKEYRKAKA